MIFVPLISSGFLFTLDAKCLYTAILALKHIPSLGPHPQPNTANLSRLVELVSHFEIF